jgi:hypothetical protein
MMRPMRAAAAVIVLSALPASAQEVDQCVAEHSRAQDHMERSELQAAKKELLRCARESCPSIVRAECSRGLDLVRQNEASIVVDARGRDGKPTTHVRLKIDGKLVAERIGAQAIAVDPGEHVVRFELATGEEREQRVLLRQGEKNKMLRADFSPTRSEHATGSAGVSSDRAASSLPIGAIVLGAVGVAGFAGFAYFGLQGRAKESDLEAECVPYCTESQADPMYRSYLLADISLGIGLAATAAAIIVGLATPNRTERGKRRPFVVRF